MKGIVNNPYNKQSNIASVEQKNPFSDGKLFETKDSMIGRYISSINAAKNLALEELKTINNNIEFETDKVIPSLKILKEGVELMYFNYEKIFKDNCFLKAKIKTTSDSFEIINFNNDNIINNRTLTISVNRIATVDSLIGSNFFYDPQSPLDFPSGNLIINEVEIQLITSLSMQQIVDTINYSDANVSAVIIEANIGQFQMVINSNVYGSKINIFDDQDLQILAYFGINQSSATPESLGSQLTINGIVYNRNSNEIDDLDGVLENSTVILKSPTINPVVVEISQDYENCLELFQNFIKNFNSVYNVIKYNQAIDNSGKPIHKDAFLFNQPIINNLKQFLIKMFESSYSNETIKSFYHFGLYFYPHKENALVIDDKKFLSSLKTNSMSVCDFLKNNFKETNLKKTFDNALLKTNKDILTYEQKIKVDTEKIESRFNINEQKVAELKTRNMRTEATKKMLEAYSNGWKPITK